MAVAKMTVAERRARFRGWLKGSQCVYGPNVWDPISARSASDLGFEFGLLSAHVVEWTINGGEELSLATSVEYAEMARRIIRASDLSVMVTGPWGFGNALNFMRAVEELESAGVSCLTISDQELPLRFRSFKSTDGADKDAGSMNVFDEVQEDVLGGVKKGEYKAGAIDWAPRLPLDEAVALMKAALSARRDPTLAIAARTNVLAVGELSDAVKTIKAYEDAGVDAVWLTHSHRKGLEALHAGTTVPLVVGGSIFHDQSHKDPELDRFLARNGVRVGSLGNVHYKAGVKAAHEALKALRDGKQTYRQVEKATVSKELMTQLTRLDDTNDQIKRFLN